MQTPSDILLVDKPVAFSDLDMDSAVISDRATYEKKLKKLNIQ